MTGPVIEYQPVPPAPKRPDYFGIASLALATISLAAFYAGRNATREDGVFDTVMFAVLACGVLALGLAVVAILRTRGRSVVGWLAIALGGVSLLSRFHLI